MAMRIVHDLIRAFRTACDELAISSENYRHQNDAHEPVPAFEDILTYLPQSMRSTWTWEVNSRVLEAWTQDNWNAASSHILVGGENLGRGFHGQWLDDHLHATGTRNGCGRHDSTARKILRLQARLPRSLPRLP